MKASRRRNSTATYLLAAAMACAGMTCSLAWLLPKGQQASQALQASRRSLLGLVASSSVLLPEVVHAAPKQIEIFGLPNDYFKANGIYTQVEGKALNGRGVFKRDGEEFYLFLNECSEFQVDSKLTGCKGFAKEAGGKWFIDGEESKKFRVRPVESKEEKVVKAKEKVKEAKEEKKPEGSSGMPSMPSFKMPDFLEAGSVDEAPGVKPSDINVRGLRGGNTGTGEFFKTEKSEDDAFDRLSGRLGSFSPSAAATKMEPKESR